VSPKEELLDILKRRALSPRYDATLEFDDPTLEVLHDDLPWPLHRIVDGAVLAPIADARWARRSMQILAVHDDLVATAECLTSRTDPAPVDPEWGDVDWRAAWRQAVIEEADLLLTREVLRIAHPEAGIAPRASPCPDWSIEIETLADGTRRVKAVGSVRELALTTPGAPPLEYELPPPAARSGQSR
jgi:hypothetical protein